MNFEFVSGETVKCLMFVSFFLHFVSFVFGYYSWLWFCCLLRMQIYLICMIILYCFHYVVDVVLFVVVDYFAMQFLCCGFFGLSILCCMLCVMCTHCILFFAIPAMLNLQCSWPLLFTIAICSHFIFSSSVFRYGLFVCLFFISFFFFAFFPFLESSLYSFSRLHFSSGYFTACID